MMKRFVLAMVGAVILFSLAAKGATVEELKKGPVLLVTSEYTPYKDLVDPKLVALVKKYNIQICLCVREDQLTDDLDNLYKVYEKNGIIILFWPLLPKKDGLYVNKATAEKYISYLDVIYGWADKHSHKIDAIVVDVEPGSSGFAKMLKDMDKKSWPEAVGKFNRIIAKIHSHNSLAIGVGFPFLSDDKARGTHGWEDLFGGPVASVDWDYLAVMMYTTWFVETGKALGINFDAAHWVAYDYSVDLKKLWGDKAAVAIGVTSAGEGNEKVVYDTPEKIAPAIAAVRQAGIQNIGIYDMKGILSSGDPEAWFKVLRDTPPALPKKGKVAAKNFRNLVKAAGRMLEWMR